MNRSATLLLACVALAACGKGGDAAPEGQVAATVDGKEITASEVRMELGQAGADPQLAAQQQPAALRAVVNRKLLADAAVDKGLDKTPEGAMMLQKARELALIQMLQGSIARGVPKVGPGQATDYVRDNPQLFAQRRVILLDQIQAPQVPPAILKQMAPIETMEGIVALLEANKIPFRRGNGAIDPLQIDPKALKSITDLGEGKVFVTPGPQGIQIGRITGYKDAPLTGEEAQRAALAVLGQQQTVGQVRSQFDTIIKDGQKDVKINAAYEPKGGKPTKTPAPADAAK
ncbi:hypothetical protein ASG29_00510 [Sphingomonas sp. Leaf412]|uniref:hypothetical protein n=1 Tax=Sphingomonas sp. Leaf412 TaxID=1736370 RepID=UPI0006FCB597|nr:hypothetical protein [Sphingomonas sp. Leaf412]KQT34685.1 hypothetical protein ASG29_00510 [Sphingomonas sp. Leaf412]